MRYPKFLPQHGTIGFIAPSFGCNTEPYYTLFQNALKKFKEMGFQVDVGPNAYVGTGIGKSNTPQLCAKEANEYFAKESVDVLISCGGGELMCEDINFFDFHMMQEIEPKWFMGYSDNTNLTFLLNTLCDTASIYGPCASTFGMEEWHASLADTMKVLTGEKLTIHGYESWEIDQIKDEEHPLVPYHLTEKKVLTCYPKKNPSMSGRLLGGCVDCLVTLLGTKFDQVKEFTERYREDGIIWFLEVCDMNTMASRRAFWQMANAGWFDTAKGFLIGRPRLYHDDSFGISQKDAVLEILKEFQVPIVFDVDLGHLPPMMPIISGAMADVTVKENDIQIAMKLE